ncbi:hypothetical protein MLD38_022980 [Melastoma candidum]|uniref:Uncharacterized protein n=1 Tax=Melastoma candidum TaxID=119954 RepID=A0ACB9QK70_9MYRT|nr:hypothetical protein MLD38_022980 [Melastoma candidum]
MEKRAFGVVFLLAIASISQTVAQTLLTHGSIPVEKLFLGPLPVTQIRLYFHNVAAGPKATAYRIANSSITNTSPTLFGFLNMIDNLLTASPDPNSPQLGRAQGLYGSADLNAIGFFINFNFYFTSGPYNGSTLNIIGRDAVFSNNRELSVGGGTGHFRLANGIVTARTISGDVATMNAVFEFNITVYQPIP